MPTENVTTFQTTEQSRSAFKNQKTRLSQIRNNLLQSKGARDQLQKNLDIETANLEVSKELHKISNQASLFLMTEIITRRQKAIESIEKIGTYALRFIYGKGHKLVFETFDEKRKEGSNVFKMEIQIVSPYEGSELKTGLIGEVGGGVLEIISFALRIATLNWMTYSGPLMMDEAYTSMSSDEKIRAVASFLRDVTDQTGRQIIFSTHKLDIFGAIADKIIHLDKVDGAVQARYISKDTLIEDAE